MKVLHLPVNIASQITVTVRALRDIGIEARGMAHPGVITSNEEIEYLVDVSQPVKFKSYLAKFRLYSQILEAIIWADVIHWHFSWILRDAFDLKLAHFLGKKQIVEFWGSDIRIGEVEAKDNPYYAQYLKSINCNARKTLQESYGLQQQFYSAGASAIVPCKSMLPYINQKIFPETYFIRQRVCIGNYSPIFPNPDNDYPLIVHSPSRSTLKGTSAVKNAIEKLNYNYLFKFKLVENMPHDRAKELMQKCDIFVDQFVLGAHGLATLEAMAYGKPVVCYIKPSMIDKYPPDFPIVNATQENLPDVLSRLINDGQLRYELGQKGRAYVEKYHDAHMLAKELLDIYKSL